MIKGATRRRTYKAIYRLLDRVSPVPFDCGTICGAACCNAAASDEELGIMLLPGEEKVHDRHAGQDDWLEWESLSSDEFEFPESWNGKIYFVRCKNPPHCPRHLRPIQCRSFPLLPHLNEDGELTLVFNDYDLPYACPMIEEGIELDERFVKATKTVWKHLIRDPLIYDMVWGESRAREMDDEMDNG